MPFGHTFQPTYINKSRTHMKRAFALSIPRPFILFFILLLLFATSCSALVLDPRQFSDQDGSAAVDRTIHADLQVPTIQARDSSTSSTSTQTTSSSTTAAQFQMSGVASPASNPTTSPASSRDGSTPSSTSSSSTGTFTGLPQPFDSPLGNNFSSTTCRPLFTQIITDSAVKRCVPLSLLIQSSSAFFSAEQSEVSLQKTLEISCNAVSASCNDLFQRYAATVNSPTGCQAELQAQNQKVQRLFNGLLSYLPTYQAACLKVDSTKVSTKQSSDYCFTSAVESNNSADLSLFLMPLGSPLAGNSGPSCSSCTQQAMSIFATAAMNLTSPLSRTYVPAAQLINQGCGANFVNETFTPIPGSDTSDAAALKVTRAVTGAAVLMIGVFMLL